MFVGNLALKINLVISFLGLDIGIAECRRFEINTADERDKTFVRGENIAL
jgi:hypothetical protein